MAYFMQIRARNINKDLNALDQWRAIALLCVLVSHGFYFTNFVHGAGRIGVNLFFFISGILVHKSLSSLFSERSFTLYSTFLFRRFIRLFPALLFYIFSMGILTYCIQGRPGLPPGTDIRTYFRTAPFALLFLTNYWGGPQSLIHIWSVSCEMQFYAMAPLFFLICRGFPWRAVLVFYVLVFMFLFLGPALFYVYRNQGPIFDSRYHFTIAAWPMMTGFIAHFVKQRFLMPSLFAKILFWVFLPLSLGSFVVMFFGLESKAITIAIGTFFIIPCYISFAKDWFLKGKLGFCLVWLGRRTYSIYLWQEPLTICNILPAVAQPLGSVFSIFLGALSYALFERPFLTTSRRKQAL